MASWRPVLLWLTNHYYHIFNVLPYAATFSASAPGHWNIRREVIMWRTSFNCLTFGCVTWSENIFPAVHNTLSCKPAGTPHRLMDIFLRQSSEPPSHSQHAGHFDGDTVRIGHHSPGNRSYNIRAKIYSTPRPSLPRVIFLGTRDCLLTCCVIEQSFL